MWAGGETRRMCEQVEDVGGWREKENVERQGGSVRGVERQRGYVRGVERQITLSIL